MVDTLKCCIVREDRYGTRKIVHPKFLEGIEANRLADTEYPDCHVMTYRHLKEHNANANK